MHNKAAARQDPDPKPPSTITHPRFRLTPILMTKMMMTMMTPILMTMMIMMIMTPIPMTMMMMTVTMMMLAFTNPRFQL